MKWTKELPTKVGWYWVRESWRRRPDERKPYILEVRMYFDQLAVQNSYLTQWEKERYEWAGPIELPKE